MKKVWIMFCFAILIGLMAALFAVFRQPSSRTEQEHVLPVPSVIPLRSAQTTKIIETRNIKDVDQAFMFTAEIPETWQVEAVPATEAISIYDPAFRGENNLEKSQIFIRHFTASDFLTLATVIIHSRNSRTINDRSAVEYDIEKKAGVAAFVNQPSWRNARHVVTDIRISDSSPSIFYVIAKRPDVSDEIYENFLQSLRVVK